MFHRILKPSKNNSFFLFGARGTGKSTFVQQQFGAGECWTIDLLDPEQEDRFLRQPMALERDLLAMKRRPDWVLIDEVQKAPALLNTVHRLIENQKQKFILTGSSARKLKRGAANLLAGRAFLYHLFPLTFLELGESFDLAQALHWGTLPKIFSLKDPSDRQQYLRSYSLAYLKEEIQAEQIVRKLDPFRSFLEVSAQCSGKVINFSKIAKDVGADTKTVQNYFSILEETWIGFFLPAYHRSVRKSQRFQPKFYYFDLGVKKALEHSLESSPTPGTSSYGEAFEHFVILEAFRLNEYFRKDFKFSFFSTRHGSEVDLVLSKPRSELLIEIKSTARIDEGEVRALAETAKAFGSAARTYYVSRDPHRVQVHGVDCLPWQDFFKEVFVE